MPPSFFDLPREIRDIIYHHVLVSPTGYITPITGAQSRQTNPQYHLCHNIYAHDPPTACPLPSHHLTLSLPRTSRQIHSETQHLLWTCNTFLFSKPRLLTTTLKAMAQTPSRLITRISLPLTLITLDSLPRALRLLASRARCGAFRCLTLTVERGEMIRIFRCRMKEAPVYERLLEVLREGGKEARFDRVLEVSTMLREWRVGGGLEHEAIRELHFAWGGRMVVNGELEWVDYGHVGRCVGVV